MGISHSEAYAAAGVDIEAGYQVLSELLLDRAKHR